MLGSAAYPEEWPDPVKLAALAVAAEGVSATVERPRINVTFEAGVNAAGIHQEACTLCGDCVSGCNHNAKNTVLVNYLPDAVAHRAEIFCETPVRTVRPAAGGAGWIVTFDTPGDGRHRLGAPPRSSSLTWWCWPPARSGPPRSSCDPAPRAWPSPPGWDLGSAATATSWRSPTARRSRCAASAPAAATPTAETSVGPTITGMVDLTADRSRALLVEEGAIPVRSGR